MSEQIASDSDRLRSLIDDYMFYDLDGKDERIETHQINRDYTLNVATGKNDTYRLRFTMAQNDNLLLTVQGRVSHVNPEVTQLQAWDINNHKTVELDPQTSETVATELLDKFLMAKLDDGDQIANRLHYGLQTLLGEQVTIDDL